MKDSRFLVFDGMDGSGKTTQCRLLAEKLQARGHEVVSVVDPGGSALGLKIRELVLHEAQIPISFRAEALLFLAARAQLVEELIRPALKRGAMVLSDRYELATAVYQGYAGGLDPKELLELSRFATNGLRPDLTLVFDVTEQTAAKRRKPRPDRLEARAEEYHTKVRTGFLTLAANPDHHCQLIKADASIEAVAAKVWSIVEPWLESLSS